MDEIWRNTISLTIDGYTLRYSGDHITECAGEGVAFISDEEMEKNQKTINPRIIYKDMDLEVRDPNICTKGTHSSRNSKRILENIAKSNGWSTRKGTRRHNNGGLEWENTKW